MYVVGSLAVRKEVQGFVGRLTRASVETSSDADAAAASASPATREHFLSHTFAKRKATASATTSRFFGSDAAVASRSSGDGGVDKGASV